MKILKAMLPVLVLLVLLCVPFFVHLFRPRHVLEIAALDKTVPYRDRIEHRSFYWLLRHRGYVRPDGAFYDLDRDYLGAFPGPKPGDPPERRVDLTEEVALRSDLVYLVDTYGVHSEDLVSGKPMKAALERSETLYGGLTTSEAKAAEKALGAGRTVVAEFNTLASPTGGEARRILERTVGVHWTGWIGRFFPDLQEPGDVPAWLRRDWEREWGKPWAFTGPGWVVLQPDDHCEVLRVGVEAEPIALTLERESPVDPLLEDAKDATPYPYWFDIVTAMKDEAADGSAGDSMHASGPASVATLASFEWHLTDAGFQRLAARGLPKRFPAVVRRKPAAGGTAYYFAGDFADNPMGTIPIPFAGITSLFKWAEGTSLTARESAFYWRFYAPMMSNLLASIPHAQPAQR